MGESPKLPSIIDAKRSKAFFSWKKEEEYFLQKQHAQQTFLNNKLRLSETGASYKVQNYLNCKV